MDYKLLQSQGYSKWLKPAIYGAGVASIQKKLKDNLTMSK